MEKGGRDVSASGEGEISGHVGGKEEGTGRCYRVRVMRGLDKWLGDGRRDTSK